MRVYVFYKMWRISNDSLNKNVIVTNFTVKNENKMINIVQKFNEFETSSKSVQKMQNTAEDFEATILFYVPSKSLGTIFI